MATSDECHNHILRRLSSEDWERIQPRLEPVSLSFKEPLINQGAPIEAVYFINAGVGSIVTDLNNGETVETRTVGREGLVGVPAVLGAHVSPWRAFCQMPGHAFRLSADALQEELARAGSLRREILRYVNAAMAMVAQSAACNSALH